MTRNRHRTIAALRALEHVQPPRQATQAEVEHGALADFLTACLIAGLWAFAFAWWVL